MITIREIGGKEFDFTAWPYNKSYIRRFLVETDDCNVGPVAIGEVMQAQYNLNFYPVASTYRLPNGEHDDTVILKSVRIRQDSETENARWWTVELNYGTWNPDTNSVNPLAQPYEIQFGYAQFEYTAFVARNDDDGDFTIPIVNSAGDVFSPQIMIEDSRPTMTVTRNEKVLDPSVLNTYKDAVNSDKFFGCDPGFVKISNISAQRQVHTMIGYFFVVTYEFVFKLDNGGHVKRVLDAGFNKLVSDGAGGQRKVKIMVNNQEPTEPQLLDGSGNPLPPNTAPVYFDWKVYKTAKFGDLKLE